MFMFASLERISVLSSYLEHTSSRTEYLVEWKRNSRMFQRSKAPFGLLLNIAQASSAVCH